MSEYESPKELLRRIYDEEFGFLPTNASMKPVHVANGLARRIVGVTTDHMPLARVLRQFVQNQRGGFKEEANPNSAILNDYGPKFTDHHGHQPADEALTTFRSLAKDTLGADDAVFPTGETSFTLSHRHMITTDVSDNGAGDFLAGLLNAGSPTKDATASTVLRSLLDSNTDPWTMIGWPLIGSSEEKDAPLGPAAQLRAERSSKLLATNGLGELESATLRELRARYDQLASYEDAFGSKLTTLRRLVIFGAFVIHVHMIRRAGDLIADGPRPPILLDLFDGNRRSLREASAATLQAGFRAVEQTVLHRIHENLLEMCGTSPEKYIASLPESEEVTDLQKTFEAESTGVEPLDALTEAFWKSGYSSVGPGDVKGGPWNSLLALGRRSGYLLPYDNRGRGGKEHKRYGITAEFAEVLVAATVTPGDPLDFDDFLDVLRASFGIVIGRTADYEAIRRNDLRTGAEMSRSVSVNETDLRANLLAFRDLIVDIGFGKSYADGRTVVTTDEVQG